MTQAPKTLAHTPDGGDLAHDPVVNPASGYPIAVGTTGTGRVRITAAKEGGSVTATVLAHEASKLATRLRGYGPCIKVCAPNGMDVYVVNEQGMPNRVILGVDPAGYPSREGDFTDEQAKELAVVLEKAVIHEMRALEPLKS